jgi:hypothetical protein
MVSRLDVMSMNMNNMNMMNDRYDTVVSGRSRYHCDEGATSTTGPVPMALTVAATAVAHQRAGQLGGSARSTSLCGGTSYQGGCHLQAGTNESFERTQENMNIGNVQEEWESSRNQRTDQSDFDFRIEAKEGAADYPHQPVLVEQQEEAGSKKTNLKSQAVTTPKAVLQPTGCQVRCREKQDHKLSNCPKY